MVSQNITAVASNSKIKIRLASFDPDGSWAYCMNLQYQMYNKRSSGSLWTNIGPPVPIRNYDKLIDVPYEIARKSWSVSENKNEILFRVLLLLDGVRECNYDVQETKVTCENGVNGEGIVYSIT